MSMDCTPAMVHFYARQMQIAWECLAELFTSGDNRVCFQAAAFVASGHIYARMPQTALFTFRNVANLLKRRSCDSFRLVDARRGFRRTSTKLWPLFPKPLYWANYLFLMCGGPEPHATADLRINSDRSYRSVKSSVLVYVEFISYSSKVTQFFFRICPLIMHTQGILLVRDAILLRGILPTDRKHHVFAQFS